MSIRLVLAASVLVVTAGCGKADDPFTTDMKMICSAGQGRDDLPPDLRRMQAMRDIAAKIKTPEAARLLVAVMQAAPSEKAAVMADALAKAGLARCPLLEQ